MLYDFESKTLINDKILILQGFEHVVNSLGIVSEIRKKRGSKSGWQHRYPKKDSHEDLANIHNYLISVNVKSIIGYHRFK